MPLALAYRPPVLQSSKNAFLEAESIGYSESCRNVGDGQPVAGDKVGNPLSTRFNLHETHEELEFARQSFDFFGGKVDLTGD